MAETTKTCEFKPGIDIEKIAVYAGLLVTFVTAMIYLADIKERLREAEVRIEKIEEKMKSDGRG